MKRCWMIIAAVALLIGVLFWYARHDRAALMIPDETDREVEPVAIIPEPWAVFEYDELPRQCVWSLAFSPDGNTLAAGRHNGTVELWDVPASKLRATLSWDMIESVHSVAFSGDGKFLASGGISGTVRLWDLSTGREKFKLQGHSLYIESVTFSPDSKLLASGSSDETAKIWDVNTGEEKVTLRGQDGFVFCVAFSPAGNILAAANHSGTVAFWDVATGQCAAKLRGHELPATSIAFSPDGKLLISGSSAEGKAKLWSLSVFAEGQFALQAEYTQWPLRVVAFSPDGKLLASCGCPSWRLSEHESASEVSLWDVAAKRKAVSIRGRLGHPWAMAVSPSGKFLAIGGRDGAIRLWDMQVILKDGKQARKPSGAP